MLELHDISFPGRTCRCRSLRNWYWYIPNVRKRISEILISFEDAKKICVKGKL